mmetsp:Transcript_378/g.808  ORF Transcript_378/g.808 Transcript_378/m.808 type:complete len:271 (+) Transcript_378:363-1175(+)|eukprot:CAMPEP_0201890730 /NCGR_PEP_ID=MMETSP0902-20130614/32844_1 /ASSEMBLY_ACC=CAM_ASM_000551 /TAXON_ID=420261 /ORGANISM="Thalassiosira antarctica, Strain CCMP982" /LENGTH=270 /DNA_ID=CAMNT_0048421671 /DNA_START=71 /DNA_END=883 /DNA_ORIENTATION=+
MNFIRKISFDRAALSLVTIAAAGVLGEAATRSSLGDAQSAKECRYPPLGSIVTEDHVRELEEKSVVVIHNVLSDSMLRCARENVEALSIEMDVSSNDSDVRQDQILSIRENDEHDHEDALIHCIKLLRGIPFILGKFGYVTSHSHIVPRQCQLAMYKPDGSVYVRHLDQCNSSLNEMGLVGWLRASDYRHRVVTAILYLNASDWDGGGELRLFDEDGDDKHSDIVPSGGKLILFDSSRIEHQVLASHGDDRYALTCWFNGDLAQERTVDK